MQPRVLYAPLCASGLPGQMQSLPHHTQELSRCLLLGKMGTNHTKNPTKKWSGLKRCHVSGIQ